MNASRTPCRTGLGPTGPTPFSQVQGDGRRITPNDALGFGGRATLIEDEDEDRGDSPEAGSDWSDPVFPALASCGPAAVRWI